jgi:VWFA-related protein
MADVPNLRLRRRAVACLGALACLSVSASIVTAQSPATQPSDKTQAPSATQDRTTYQAKDAPELATHDTANTFKVRVNLVLVRVVVRDEKGKVVENLHKEDFRLFDNRKEQSITAFSIETPSSHIMKANSTEANTPADPGKPPVQVALPDRFVALLFDDVHLSMDDAAFSRTAAAKIFDSLGPSDRVAIFTTSGQFKQDFTNDKDLLRQSLLSILPHPMGMRDVHACPDVSYYMADLILNKNDPQAIAVATTEAIDCAFNGDTTQENAARAMAEAAATAALSSGDSETEYAYRHMEDVVRRLTVLPGQRTLVLISPGFIESSLMTEASGLIDAANQHNIVINTLDARGLYTPDLMGDIADPVNPDPKTAGIQASYRVASQSANDAILADLAYGTGGTNYHNRNDIDVALREAVDAPAVSYLLGFSPQNLKLNGSFHTIGVKLAAKSKYTIQARRGYAAPRTLKDPTEQAKEEIREAVFSQDEIGDIPLELHTQFFKKDQTDVQLSVLAHVDLKTLPFQKTEGRNRNDLTLATAIFDENGNFITGGEKILEMRLFDSTLERVQRSGITVKSSFEVKPGNYLVRLVVRDAQGAEMAARNGAVAIPY